MISRKQKFMTTRPELQKLLTGFLNIDGEDNNYEMEKSKLTEREDK